MDDMNPKRLDRLLVACCSTCHKSHPLHVSRWDEGQTKQKTKVTHQKIISQRWFLFILSGKFSFK